MNQFFAWLKEKFFRPQAPSAPDQPSNRVSNKPDDVADDDYTIEMSFDSDVPGPIESQEYRKNVLMPDIYADGHVATEPKLKIIDLRSPGVDNSVRFNPHCTDSVQK